MKHDHRSSRLAVIAALSLAGIGVALLASLIGKPTDPPPALLAALPIASPTPSPSMTVRLAEDDTGASPLPAVDIVKSASPRQSPQTIRSVRFEVPLSFMDGGPWIDHEDTPREFRIAFAPDAFGNGNPLVTVGIPYGYDSAAEFVRTLKTLRYPPGAGGLRVKDLCPAMAAPEHSTLIGLSGYSFDCWTERNIDFIPIYPKDRQGARLGVPASLDAAGDWFVIPKGAPYLRFFVADIHGTTIVISIAGAGRGGGPSRALPELTPDTIARFESLDLRFRVMRSAIPA